MCIKAVAMMLPPWQDAFGLQAIWISAACLPFGPFVTSKVSRWPLGEGRETVGSNCGKAGEDIAAPAVGWNEARTFGFAKPLDAVTTS